MTIAKMTTETDLITLLFQGWMKWCVARAKSLVRAQELYVRSEIDHVKRWDECDSDPLEDIRAAMEEMKRWQPRLVPSTPGYVPHNPFPFKHADKADRFIVDDIGHQMRHELRTVECGQCHQQVDPIMMYGSPYNHCASCHALWMLTL